MCQTELPFLARAVEVSSVKSSPTLASTARVLTPGISPLPLCPWPPAVAQPVMQASSLITVLRARD
jgi:hypothetical protein